MLTLSVRLRLIRTFRMTLVTLDLRHCRKSVWIDEAVVIVRHEDLEASALLKSGLPGSRAGHKDCKDDTSGW